MVPAFEDGHNHHVSISNEDKSSSLKQARAIHENAKYELTGVSSCSNVTSDNEIVYHPANVVHTK